MDLLQPASPLELRRRLSHAPLSPGSLAACFRPSPLSIARRQRSPGAELETGALPPALPYQRVVVPQFVEE